MLQISRLGDGAFWMRRMRRPSLITRHVNRHLTEGMEEYGRPEEGGLQAEGASEAEALRGKRWVCVCPGSRAAAARAQEARQAWWEATKQRHDRVSRI